MNADELYVPGRELPGATRVRFGIILANTLTPLLGVDVTGEGARRAGPLRTFVTGLLDPDVASGAESVPDPYGVGARYQEACLTAVVYAFLSDISDQAFQTCCVRVCNALTDAEDTGHIRNVARLRRDLLAVIDALRIDPTATVTHPAVTITEPARLTA